MVTVPQRVSSQTEKDRLCVRPMATPVPPYVKEGWHSVSSRVTGPQSFDQMVWSDTRRSVGLGRSDGRRGTGQTRVGFVHERFLSSQHHRAVFDARFIPPWQILQDDQSQCPLHRGVQKPPDQTGIRTILLQAFPYRWRQVLRLFKRITSRPFGYLMLDVHPASDDRYRLWSYLTPREGKAQVHTLPFENALQRELERQRRQREGGQHTDLSTRMDTPTLSPAGVGSPTAPPPSMDLSSMTDMVTEMSRPVDRTQLDQEIEDFNLTYPVNVDDAVNLFSLPPWQAPATPQQPPRHRPSPPLLKPNPPSLPEHALRPPPDDPDPLRPPEHAPSPPPRPPLPHRASPPLTAVPVQGQGPPPRR